MMMSFSACGHRRRICLVPEHNGYMGPVRFRRGYELGRHFGKKDGRRSESTPCHRESVAAAVLATSQQLISDVLIQNVLIEL